MKLRVLIIDQERTFADALATRLEAEPDISVVAAIGVQLPVSRPVVAQSADVTVLDADLPGRAAFALCREIAGRGIATHVIMMSYSAEAERVLAAVRAGATAWVPKGESLDHLLSVLRGIEGGVWLPPAVTGQVLTMLLRQPLLASGNDLVEMLTPREREVLVCLAEGVARRDVAARLSLSANTVRTHLQNLMSKLQVHSTLEAVALTRSELTRMRLQDPLQMNDRALVPCAAGDFISSDLWVVNKGEPPSALREPRMIAYRFTIEGEITAANAAEAYAVLREVLLRTAESLESYAPQIEMKEAARITLVPLPESGPAAGREPEDPRRF